MQAGPQVHPRKHLCASGHPDTYVSGLHEAKEQTMKPKKKVASGGVGGAIATVLIALFPDAVTPELAAAIATIASFVLAWVVPG